MRKPENRNSAISNDRLNRWLNRFAAYRQPPNRHDINHWLNYFKQSDRDIAARILDCVEIISEETIHDGYREALGSLPGWDRYKNRRSGRWFFVGFGGAIESGPAMLRLFREANRLNASGFDDLFKNSTELPHLALTALDNVVFIDDLSGSGNQVCNNWNTIKELMGSNSKTYLILSAATKTAKDRIGSETDAILIASHNLGDDDNVFSYKCKFFNSIEKITLLRYCKKADGKNPKGFRNCGLLFVLSHKTPNNTLPILHANHPKWRGLFPRYL